MVLEAYAPTSNGVKSVSPEYTRMSSVATPSTSAAIWANTVSAPVPRSAAPTRRLNDPSSLILIEHAPMSTNGMPDPCMHSASPIPRRMCGRSGGCFHRGSSRRCQPIARRPCATHSSRPQVVTCGMSSGAISSTTPPRSPRRSTMSSASPGCTQFVRRNATGSRCKARAMSSICDSSPKNACGAP